MEGGRKEWSLATFYVYIILKIMAKCNFLVCHWHCVVSK